MKKGTIADGSAVVDSMPNRNEPQRTDMPAKSGASHGIAAFVALVVGTVMSEYLTNLAPPLGETSMVTIELIRSTTGIDLPMSEQFAGMVVVMVGLSFAWGIVYHYGRHS
ncbi:MAG: hypothetical protein ACI9YT_000876 [Halobacteriales archaeon]|jgi:hypothetical protein